jgi:HPt (histidine-containing phosphotransfer) domain-containing protein
MKRHRDLFEQAGANDFLNKPIHQQELNRVLQHYLKPDDQSEQAVEDDEPLISDELRILFIERVIEQRKVLPILLREQNWPEIRLVAHNMKGSCDIYGYSEIADTGKNISDEIDAGSYDVVVPLVSQLIEQLGGVE